MTVSPDQFVRLTNVAANCEIFVPSLAAGGFQLQRVEAPDECLGFVNTAARVTSCSLAVWNDQGGQDLSTFRAPLRPSADRSFCLGAIGDDVILQPNCSAPSINQLWYDAAKPGLSTPRPIATTSERDQFYQDLASGGVRVEDSDFVNRSISSRLYDPDSLKRLLLRPDVSQWLLDRRILPSVDTFESPCTDTVWQFPCPRSSGTGYNYRQIGLDWFNYQILPSILIAGTALEYWSLTPYEGSQVAAGQSGALLSPNQKGQIGLQRSGLQQNLQTIPSLTKTTPSGFRIPDGLDVSAKVVSEVKWVGKLAYTAQLRDYSLWATANGYRFDLYVKSGATLTDRLQSEIAAGRINLISI